MAKNTITTAILWCNLGTPEAPNTKAVRRYLAQFLSDPRVVDLPRWWWLPILHTLVLWKRPAKSAQKYAKIWTKEGSPLLVWTHKQAKLLQGWLGHNGHRVIVAHAMRYGKPSIAHVVHKLQQQGIQRILLLSAYPQYSSTTTASLIDDVSTLSYNMRCIPEWRTLNQYHDHPAYIQALVHNVRKHWQQHERGKKLIMSFHGIPQRTCTLGDPYEKQCHITAKLLAHQLDLDTDEYCITFQSRFGKAQWLQPYTEPTLKKFAQQGIDTVDVICPGFVSDCLETLEEINMDVRTTFMHAGGKQFNYIHCLNDSPQWIAALGDIAATHLSGWNTKQNI